MGTHTDELEEYRALYQQALAQVRADPAITDPERTARGMVEAYYRGRLDRQRLEQLREQSRRPRWQTRSIAKELTYSR